VFDVSVCILFYWTIYVIIVISLIIIEFSRYYSSFTFSCCYVIVSLRMIFKYQVVLCAVWYVVEREHKSQFVSQGRHE